MLSATAQAFVPPAQMGPQSMYDVLVVLLSPFSNCAAISLLGHLFDYE